MGDEIIFRIRHTQRVSTLLLSVLIPILAMLIFLIIFPWGILLESITNPMILISFLLVVCFLLLAIYNGFHVWQDRLVFTDTHIERRGLPRPRVYRGPESYENVVEIRRGIYGSIIIETSTSKRFQFSPKAYEGGTAAIMEELRKRVPSDRFQSDLETRLLIKTKAEIWGTVFMAVGFVLVYVWLFYENAFDLIRRDVGWNLEVKGTLSENLEDFALGDDGSIWLLIQNYPGEYKDPSNYEVRQLRDGEEEIYTLPKLEALYPESSPRPHFTFPQAIFLNDSGNPELYFHSEQPRLLWNGASWEWEGLPQDEDTSTFDKLFEVTNDPYWKALGQNKIIRVADPLTGQIQEFDLGSFEGGYYFNYHPSPYGWIVAHVEGLDGRSFFHRFKENSERKTWYEISPPMFKFPERTSIIDYTTDPLGLIYVLYRDHQPCIDGTFTQYASKLDPVEGELRWQTLKHPDDCEDLFVENQLLVDAHGRLWTLIDENVIVFNPSIFETEVVQETDYIIYSEYNSGFYEGGIIQVGPDGRFWSLDGSGDALVSLNPDAGELDKPLPPWPGVLVKKWELRMGLMYGGLGIAFVGMVLVFSSSRKKR